MRRFSIILLLSAVALAGDDKPKEPPRIDYKLQFEMRTLEMNAQALDFKTSMLAERIRIKREEMGTACGTKHAVAVNRESLEYECVVIQPQPQREGRNAPAPGVIRRVPAVDLPINGGKGVRPAPSVPSTTPSSTPPPTPPDAKPTK